MNWYDNNRKNLERATVGIETNDEKRMNHRKELEKHEDTWGNPEAIERRDRELIEEYLNEAPVQI